MLFSMPVLLALFFSLLYYAPSVPLLFRPRLGTESHWQSKLLMYAVYFLFYALAFSVPSADGHGFYLVSIPVCAAGVYLHATAIAALGRAYSAGTKFSRKTALVTKGVYSLARHPLYSASALFFLGLTLLLPSVYSFAGYALVLLYLRYRVGVEESFLVKRYGRAYVEYRKRVPATVFGWLEKIVRN